MLVYYFVPFIFSNLYLLFWVSNGHNSVTVQNRTHVYMNFFHHKDLGNHLLQLCPKVVKQPVYIHYIYIYIHTYIHTCIYIHTYIFIHTYTHIYIHTYIYTYIYTYIHTYTRTYVRTVENGYNEIGFCDTSSIPSAVAPPIYTYVYVSSFMRPFVLSYISS